MAMEFIGNQGGADNLSLIKVGFIDDVLKQGEWARVVDGKKDKNELMPFPRDRGTARVVTSAGDSDDIAPAFVLGSSGPKKRVDLGSGQWGSETPEISSYFKKGFVEQTILPYARLIYPDAADHLRHYFGNTGLDYRVNLQRIVETTDAGRDFYLSQQNAAMNFASDNAVEGIPLSFSSQRMEQRRFSGDENWMRASGTFSGWSNATVVRTGNSFSMNFDLHYFDPYNWNNGQEFTSFGVDVKDDFMAAFHKQGLAREFNLVGLLPLKITWQAGRQSDFLVKIRD